MTDLVNPDSPPEEWVANGEYWTNKRRSKKDDDSRGTWGHMQLRFKRRTPASAAVEEFCPEDKSWLAEEALRTSEPPAPSPRAIP